MNKKNAARSLIERASCQLRGEKAPIRVSTEEEDIQAYLSGLSQKTGTAASSTSTPVKPKPAFPFEEFSDLSLSEGDLTPRRKKKPEATNKYLKKKKDPEPEKPAEKFVKKPVVKDNQKENSVPLGGRTAINSAAKSSPLSKIAAFEEKFRNKKAAAVKYQMSDSDLDSMTFSTSMENELAKEVPGLKTQKITKSRPKKSPDPNNNESFVKKKPTVTSGQPSLSKTMHKFGTKSNLSKFSDEDSNSLGIGKGSSKFIKKKPTPSQEPTPTATKTADVRNSPTATKKLRFDLSEDSDMMDVRRKSADPPLPSTQPLKPALKTSSSFRMSRESDSDLADYIDMADLSTSTTTSSPRRKAQVQRQRVVEEDDTPRPSSKPYNFQTSSSFGETVILSDPFEALDNDEEHSIQESIGTEDSYKSDKSDSSVPEEVNVVMDIGSLEPIGRTEKKHQKRSQSPERKKKNDMKQDKGKSVDKNKKGTKSKTKSNDNDFFSSMGLMSVDDLLGAKAISDEEVEEAPVFGQKKTKRVEKKSEKKSKKTKNETSDFFSSFGLQTVDDLLGGGVSGESVQDESEIIEVPETPRSEITAEIHTISEPRSFGGGYSYDEDFESEIKTDVSKKSREDSIPYTDDFETSVSEILTEKETPRSRRKSSYTESDESDTLTPTPSDDEETVSYSESYTSYSDSRTSYTDSRSVVMVRKKETRAVEVQTMVDGGLGYHWNSQGVGMSYMQPPIGLGYTDPTPIASHVVSPDSIEAMTAYSPNMIALNDMLRMQIQLTQQFVTMQRRLYDSLATSVQDSYQYTTLEDTKEYIKQNRKPTLTFDEALKMVNEEMGGR